MNYQASHIVTCNAGKLPPRAKTENEARNAVCYSAQGTSQSKVANIFDQLHFPPPPANFTFLRILKHVKETCLLSKYLKHFRFYCFCLFMTSITVPRKVLTWPKSTNEPAILVTSKTPVQNSWREQERNIGSRNVGTDRSQIKNDWQMLSSVSLGSYFLFFLQIHFYKIIFLNGLGIRGDKFRKHKDCLKKSSQITLI